MKHLWLLAAGAILTWLGLGLITGNFDTQILIILAVGVYLGYAVGKRNPTQDADGSLEERVR